MQGRSSFPHHARVHVISAPCNGARGCSVHEIRHLPQKNPTDHQVSSFSFWPNVPHLAVIFPLVMLMVARLYFFVRTSALACGCAIRSRFILALSEIAYYDWLFFCQKRVRFLFFILNTIIANTTPLIFRLTYLVFTNQPP
jgi:hypothetical protein